MMAECRSGMCTGKPKQNITTKSIGGMRRDVQISVIVGTCNCERYMASNSQLLIEYAFPKAMEFIGEEVLENYHTE